MDDFVIVAFSFISVMLVASVSLNLFVYRSVSKLSKSFTKLVGVDRDLQLSEVVCVDVPSFHSMNNAINRIDSTVSNEDVIASESIATAVDHRRHSIGSSSGAFSSRSESPLLLSMYDDSARYYNQMSFSSDRPLFSTPEKPLSSTRVDVIRYTDIERSFSEDSFGEQPVSTLLEAASRSFNPDYVQHDDCLKPTCQRNDGYLLSIAERDGVYLPPLSHR